MSSDGASVRFAYPFEGVDVPVVALERALWILVGLVLVGDVVTTFVGLQLGLAESNPIARGLIDGYGLIGMLALKTFALAVGVGCRQLLDREYRPIVPAGLAVPWTIAVASNVYVISTVV